MLIELIINGVIAVGCTIGGMYLGTYLKRRGITQATIMAHAEAESKALRTEMKDEYGRLLSVVKAAAAKHGVTL